MAEAREDIEAASRWEPEKRYLVPLFFIETPLIDSLDILKVSQSMAEFPSLNDPTALVAYFKFRETPTIKRMIERARIPTTPRLSLLGGPRLWQQQKTGQRRQQRQQAHEPIKIHSNRVIPDAITGTPTRTTLEMISPCLCCKHDHSSPHAVSYIASLMLFLEPTSPSRP